MKKIILIIVTSALIATMFFLPNVKVSCACDCAIENDYEKALEQSDVVFDGYVTNKKSPKTDLFGISSSASFVKWSFEVKGSWKGEITEKVVVYSAQSGASCGYEFEVGKRYIVFGYMEEDKLIVSLCSSTRELSDQSSVHEALSSYKGTVIADNNTDESMMQEGNDSESDSSNIASMKAILYIGIIVILAAVIAAFLIIRNKKKRV